MAEELEWEFWKLSNHKILFDFDDCLFRAEGFPEWMICQEHSGSTTTRSSHVQGPLNLPTKLHHGWNECTSAQRMCAVVLVGGSGGTVPVKWKVASGSSGGAISSTTSQGMMMQGNAKEMEKVYAENSIKMITAGCWEYSLLKLMGKKQISRNMQDRLLVVPFWGITIGFFLLQTRGEK